MSFDRYFTERNRSRNGDHRTPYYDTRRFDWGCRHGGSCTYCSNNRTFSNRRRTPIVIDDEILDVLDGVCYTSICNLEENNG